MGLTAIPLENFTRPPQHFPFWGRLRRRPINPEGEVLPGGKAFRGLGLIFLYIPGMCQTDIPRNNRNGLMKKNIQTFSERQMFGLNI